MKLSLAEIKMLENSLTKVIDKDINIKMAFRLGKFLKTLNDEMRVLEDSRIKLVKKYGKENETTKQIEVPNESQSDFYQEFNGLMQEQLEISFEPIPLSAFGDIEMSAADVFRLEGIVIKNDLEVEKEKKVEKEVEKKEEEEIIKEIKEDKK
jgi:hypothetical protein